VTQATHKTSREALAGMAARLQAHQLDAYYLPPEDEHLNEYLPENKKRITWLTGFAGESAPLLVTAGRFYLYVDGRFHIQVDDEVDAAVTEAHKLGPDESGDQCIQKFLKQQADQATMQKPYCVGYDPFLVSPNRLKRLQGDLKDNPNLSWCPIPENLVDAVWSDRPALPKTPAFLVGPDLTGKSTADKLAEIRAALKNAGATLLPITRLDDIAWLYNLRGGDIPYNPVLEAYAILTATHAYLFTRENSIPAKVQSELAANGIEIELYTRYPQTLKTLVSKPQTTVLVDRGGVTTGTLDIVTAHAPVVENDNPVTLAKALKNPTEIDKMRLANFRASRAIIRHLMWVEKAFSEGQRLSEAVVRDNLEAKYKEEPEFFDLSFPTIPGIGTNSAIIHYSHANPDQVGQAGDFYLLDSGCQYLGGTTDTTRTTVLGKSSPEQIEKYTAVLKAHIACAAMRFPEGTKGMQLDAVCREPMWQLGLDFAHGTGHGVGAFLNVHEGPNRISRVCSVVFQAGMVTSIEPGYYQKDWGGIRLENLYVVVEDTGKPAFMGKKWLAFDSLTLAPFEKKLIDFSALAPVELAWLKTHYQKIMTQVGPTLSPAEQTWLAAQCDI